MGKIIYTITETNHPSKKAISDFHEVLYTLMTKLPMDEGNTTQTQNKVA